MKLEPCSLALLDCFNFLDGVPYKYKKGCVYLPGHRAVCNQWTGLLDLLNFPFLYISTGSDWLFVNFGVVV